MRHFSLAIAVLLFTAPVLAEEPAAEKITYNDHILPLFKQRCGSCHNANDRKGGLTLDNYAGTMQGGSSGSVVEGATPARAICSASSRTSPNQRCRPTPTRCRKRNLP